LRLPWQFKPAQPRSGQRSGPKQRPVRPGPAGVLFQSRAARRLRANIFALSGGGFTTAHDDGSMGVAMAHRSAGGAFVQSRHGKAAAALCLGNGLWPGTQTAPAIGSSSHPAMPPVPAATRHPGRSAAANGGTSPAGLSVQRLSSRRFSTAFSASFSGIKSLRTATRGF